MFRNKSNTHYLISGVFVCLLFFTLNVYGGTEYEKDEIALSNALTITDSYRIVLGWGKTPKNLDSHLWVGNSHIFPDNKKGNIPNTYSEMDLDDTDSFGPETITIHKMLPDVKYYYTVHDYTNKQKRGSNELSTISDARVYVYSSESKEPIMRFHVPRGKTGNKWDVFYIDENGEIGTINRISYSDASEGKDVKP